MKKDLIALLGLDEKATDEQIIAAVAAIKGKLAALEETQKQASADEVIVREKMQFGLTREQALNVIKRQRAHDAAEKAAAENKANAASKK